MMPDTNEPFVPKRVCTSAEWISAGNDGLGARAALVPIIKTPDADNARASAGAVSVRRP
jgi:hypothetical protein